MAAAFAASTRGTCPRAEVGAVLALDGSSIATGYNGSPRGLAHCSVVGCAMIDGHCVRAVHAEANALLQGLRRGDVGGAVLYTTHLPCIECAKLIINARVSRVVYAKHYAGTRAASVEEPNGASYSLQLTGQDLLREAGIVINKVTPATGLLVNALA